jgi:hypothetical protein
MSDCRVTVTCPVELAAVASAVGRAMDIDVGGADSFVPVYASYDSYGKPVGEPIELCAQTWASQEFTEMFQYLIANPIGLYMAVSADYALRWGAMEPPDLPSIEAFCNAATLRIT